MANEKKPDAYELSVKAETIGSFIASIDKLQNLKYSIATDVLPLLDSYSELQTVMKVILPIHEKYTDAFNDFLNALVNCHDMDILNSTLDKMSIAQQNIKRALMEQRKKQRESSKKEPPTQGTP